jgi:hypothetical protein
VFIDGELTHAVRKNALLTGPAEDTSELYAEEEKSSFEATPAQVEVAQRALTVAREATGAEFTYARVDLVSGDDGVPMVIELELTEPSLWMKYGEGVEGKLADAVVKLLG